MTNTKKTTSTMKFNSKTDKKGFAIPSTAIVDPKINEKLEQNMTNVFKDMNKMKTLNDYFKDIIDTRLVQNKDEFKIIRALLSQVEDNIGMPVYHPQKLNTTLLIQREISKEPSSAEDSIIKSASFYSDWKTPKSTKNIESKIKELERSNKQRNANTFIRKTQKDLKSILNTINLKKDKMNKSQALKETQMFEAQKSSKEVLRTHKKEQIVSHLKKIKKQKAKRLKILKEANKKYQEMKAKPALYEKMESAYTKKLDRTIKSVKIEKKKIFKPWDYEKLKEHEQNVTKSFKDRMQKINNIKKIPVVDNSQIFKDTSKLELIKKQKEFARLVQTKYKPTNFTENTIERELQKKEFERELQREDLFNRIKENEEKSKNYLQESLNMISRKPKKHSNDDKENKSRGKTVKNYLPEISKNLKKKAPETLDCLLTKPVNAITLPAIMTDINKYESMSKSKLLDLGKGSISKKTMDTKEAHYKGIIDAKLNLLNKMKQ